MFSKMFKKENGLFQKVNLLEDEEKEVFEFTENEEYKKKSEEIQNSLEKQFDKEEESKKRVNKAVNLINYVMGEIQKDNYRFGRELLIDVTPEELDKVKKIANFKFNKECDNEYKEYSNNDYIWVDGYKATDYNMKCRDHQFEVGVEYTIEGNPIMCENGFHFCTKLKNVLLYYNINNTNKKQNRFFKVKALVKKRDYIKASVGYIEFEPIFSRYRFGEAQGLAQNEVIRYQVKILRSPKLVSKSIVLTEELGYEDMREIFNNNGILIGDEETYLKVIKEGMSPQQATISRNTERLEKYLSSTLSRIIVDDIVSSYKNPKGLQREFDKLIGLLETEGVSKEMALYLFMK